MEGYDKTKGSWYWVIQISKIFWYTFGDSISTSGHYYRITESIWFLSEKSIHFTVIMTNHYCIYLYHFLALTNVSLSEVEE